jgi:cysteine-rich repeat protein
MRIALLVVWLAIARAAGAACLDDCLIDFGGAGPTYDTCVAACGVCGNGEIEGDEDCDDGNTVGGDCCDATCRFEPAGSPCEGDDDPCTTDTCDGEGDCDDEEVPALDCRSPAVAGGATLVMRDVEHDAKDLLVWKWRRGAATTKAEFGDPTNSTTFALCIYDDVDGLLTTITLPAGGTCGPHACWAERPGGFRYRNRAREPEGAGELLLQQGRHDGRSEIVLEARGENLDLPDLESLESPLTIQLRRTGSQLCWGARYSFPPARRKGAVLFRDRSDPAPPTTSTTSTTTTTAPAPDTTSTTIAGPPTTSAPGATTTTTLGGASVEVTVVDAAGAPVAEADVTVAYAGGTEDFDFTDDAGLATFDGQPVGLAATVTAEDDNDRTGSVSSPGFATGPNRITVTVR